MVHKVMKGLLLAILVSAVPATAQTSQTAVSDGSGMQVSYSVGERTSGVCQPSLSEEDERRVGSAPETEGQS